MKPTVFLNKQTTAERISQAMDDWKIFRQNKHSILQSMDIYHSLFDKTDTYFKGRMAAIRVAK